MEFWVKLIEVSNVSCGEASRNLQANCRHVANNYWVFEGDEDALHQGIEFEIVGEEAIEGTGDLNTVELINLVSETYNIDKCFLR